MPKDTTQIGQVGKPTPRTVADESATHKKEGMLPPLTPPRISDDAADGIFFAGICRGEYGQEDYALILLPGDVKLPSWDKSMEWAAAAGGDLPSPSEQQLLRANLPEKFQAEAYWSNKQHESDSAYAWFQYFYDGFQVYGLKSAALRAVAVRRLTIQSLINSFCVRLPASASSTPLPIDVRLDAVTSLTRLCILFGVIEQLAEEGSHIADTAGMGVELATEYADKLTISATNGGTHHG